MAETDAVAVGQAFGRPHESEPPVGRNAHMQGGVDMGNRLAALPDTGQLRRDDPRVVEDQHVARLQQARQVADGTVGRRVHQA